LIFIECGRRGKGQVFFGGSGGKCNGCLNIFRYQAGEICENLFDGIATS